MEYIETGKKKGLCFITVNNPQKLNALCAAALRELDGVLKDIAADGALRCVIIKGGGAKAFIGGSDMREIKDLTPGGAAEFTELCKSVIGGIKGLSIPVIAAINGYCIGSGVEIACACDIRIAAENAKFAMPEAGIGIVCACGGTYLLPEIVGQSKAREMLFTGGTITAEEALGCGLVSKVTPSGELAEVTVKMAQKIASNAPIAIRAMKKSIGKDCSSEFAAVLGTNDAQQALTAFVENRKPEAFTNQ